MIRKPITIGISNGLEARPIAMLVQVASQYVSNIYLESEERKEDKYTGTRFPIASPNFDLENLESFSIGLHTEMG